GDPATAPYLGKVTVLGVTDAFAPPGVSGLDWNADVRRSKAAGAFPPVVLSHRVAEKLGAKVGDAVTLGVERFGEVPRSSSLAKRATDDTTAAEEFRVEAILPAESALNDFNLTPNPAAPLNVFVPLRTLSRLATGSGSPVATALLAVGTGGDVGSLNAALGRRLQMEDYGLKLPDPEVRKYVSVESTELVLPPAVVRAVLSAAKDLGVRAEPTVVYVADTLGVGGREIPYPIVAGLNPAAADPLGPFLPKALADLADDELVLLEWSGSELNGLPPGTQVRMTYYDPEVEGEGKLRAGTLALKGYITIPPRGPARDRARHLTPEIPGVTDEGANL
ncbi:MAG: hypothetical protein K2V38_21200, partial [Gemmataceae bacterium]|nr:hypothetical protein [Gemmataceae bacterium]